jgi:SPP1 gp7 family putative phage head morphogenesis protein
VWPFSRRKSRAAVAKMAAPEEVSNALTLLGRQTPPSKRADELCSAYSRVPWLHLVTNRIAEGITTIEWQVIEATAQKHASLMHQRSTTKALRRADFASRTKAVTAGDATTLAEHPILDFLAQGSPLLRGSQAMRLTSLYISLTGAAYWWLESPVGGQSPSRYWVIPEAWIKRYPQPGALDYEIRTPGGGARTIPFADMLVFRNPNPASPYVGGVGLAQVLADEFDIDEYSTKFAKSFFYNDARPGLIIYVEDASQEMIEKIRAEWDTRFRGPRNAHKPSITNRRFEVENIEATDTSQMLSSATTQARDKIISCSGLPPEMAGVLGSSNRATIEAAIDIYARFTLMPHVTMIRNTLQEGLAPRFGDPVLHHSNPIPEDKEYNLRVVQGTRGTLTRAEQRELLGLPSNGPIDDVYVMGFADLEKPVRSSSIQPSPLPEPDEVTDDDIIDDDAGAGSDEATEADDTLNDSGKHLSLVHLDKLFPNLRRKSLTAAQIQQVVDALQPQALTDPLVEELRAKMLLEAGVAAESVGADIALLQINPLIDRYLMEQGAERIAGISETTKTSLIDTLVEGVAAGEDVRNLTGRVMSTFDAAETWRAENIARTEVNGAANAATHAAYEVSGLVEEKQWVSTLDSNTRDAHAALNGRTVALETDFAIGVHHAPFPGAFGVPAMDCNCRCTHVAVVKGPKSIGDLEQVWKAHIVRTNDHEKDVIKALRRGFRAQREQVLTALAKVAGQE